MEENALSLGVVFPAVQDSAHSLVVNDACSEDEPLGDEIDKQFKELSEAIPAAPAISRVVGQVQAFAHPAATLASPSIKRPPAKRRLDESSSDSGLSDSGLASLPASRQPSNVSEMPLPDASFFLKKSPATSPKKRSRKLAKMHDWELVDSSDDEKNDAHAQLNKKDSGCPDVEEFGEGKKEQIDGLDSDRGEEPSSSGDIVLPPSRTTCVTPEMKEQPAVIAVRTSPRKKLQPPVAAPAPVAVSPPPPPIIGPSIPQGVRLPSTVLSESATTPILKKKMSARTLVKPETGCLGQRRRVRFDKLDVYYFARQQGGSTVPDEGEVTLGMVDQHHHMRSFQLRDRLRPILTQHHEELEEGEVAGDDEPCTTVTIQQIDHKRRHKMLKQSGVKVNKEVAGVSCEVLRRERRVTGCHCVGGCKPDTCECSSNGVQCQVDDIDSLPNPSPCGCSKNECCNPSGRIEFDRRKVELHYTLTRKRLLDMTKIGGDEAVASPVHIRFHDDDEEADDEQEEEEADEEIVHRKPPGVDDYKERSYSPELGGSYVGVDGASRKQLHPEALEETMPFYQEGYEQFVTPPAGMKLDDAAAPKFPVTPVYNRLIVNREPILSTGAEFYSPASRKRLNSRGQEVEVDVPCVDADATPTTSHSQSRLFPTAKSLL